MLDEICTMLEVHRSMKSLKMKLDFLHRRCYPTLGWREQQLFSRTCQGITLRAPDLQREASVCRKSRPDHNRALLQGTSVCQLLATRQIGVNLSKKLDSRNLLFPFPTEAPTIGNLLAESWKMEIYWANRKFEQEEGK